MSADVVVLGRVLTMDPARPRAEGVAIAGGRIAAVGSKSDVLALCDSSTEVVDAGAGTVLPGFYDAHQHQVYAGLRRFQVDARVEGIEALIERFRRGAASIAPPAWVEGGGYDENRMAERRGPTRRDLDVAVADRPAFVTRTCGHIMVANSAALAAAGVDAATPDPAGGHIERENGGGQPNGVLHEKAMELVRRVAPTPGPEQLAEAVLDAAGENLALGITSVWEPSVEPDHVAAYLRLEEAGRLPLRVTMAQKYVLRSGERVPLPTPFRRPWLSLVAVKLFQDGAIAPRTAALSEPYAGEPGNVGLLQWEQDELNVMVAEIHEAGLLASIHAIGDEAIESALRAIRSAQGDARPGHRIEHCGLPLGDLPYALARAGVVPVVQPPFLHFHGDVYARNVGPTRTERLYPTRTLLATCDVVAGSSDAPVVPDRNPLLGIRAAITRQSDTGALIGEAEAVSLHEALGLYTSGAAAAAGEGGWKGRLAPGYLADVVVLDCDLESLAPAELVDARPRLVLVDGKAWAA